ncbi:hypothetical protein BGX29_003640 [Mortierella sp. GBA35]|nr:hypothetical protein BGX29_003640 [Mortierella sp. GBA35]
MDSSLAEDDQAKDMADDTPEVGGGGSENVTDDGAGHDETASSGEGIAGVDSSVEDVCEVSAKTYHVSQRVRERQNYLAADLQRNVLNAIRDSLFSDPYILETAGAYGFPEDKRIIMDEKNGVRCLSFYIKAAFFKDWLKRHSDCIGTKFTLRNTPYHYSTDVKNRIKGGKTGRSTSDGLPGDTHKIEYFFEHNHQLECAENTGTMRKSEAIKLRVKAMLMRGMSINAIMEQLTMDHARFARFLEGKETMVLSRDDFITHDDVYNILYAITATEVRKSEDDTISARLWMEELDRNNYFTFYDKATASIMDSHRHGSWINLDNGATCSALMAPIMPAGK